MYTPIPIQRNRHICDNAKLRIGIFVLSSDQGIENEIMTMLPKEVKANFARMPSYVDSSERGTVHKHELSSTAELFRSCSETRVFIYGCTSGEVTFGREILVASINSVLPSAQIITPIAAAVTALKDMSLDAISILSPYDRKLNRRLHDRFESSNIMVENVYEFALLDNFDAPRLDALFFLESATRIKNDIPKCLFIPCNSLSVVSHIQKMEDLLGIPVITSTQVSIWEALKLCKHEPEDTLKRYGALFRDQRKLI